MFSLDLPRLGREKRISLKGTVPIDAQMWVDSGLTLSRPLEFSFEALEAAAGQVVVRGTVEAVLRRECRRCGLPLEVPLSEEITVVFSSTDEFADSDDEIRSLPATAHEIDLEPVVKEELLLRVRAFEDCPYQNSGLCPEGLDFLELEAHGESEPESDPRWNALRGLGSGDKA